MAGKRRKRFTWMPVLGTKISNIEPDDGRTVSGRAFGIDVFPPSGDPFPGSQGSQNVLIFPLIPDVPIDGTVAADQILPLEAIIGNEWFCERIVGSIFVGFRTPDTGELRARSVLVTAGVFVARANDQGSGGGVDQPIGSASAAERRDNYGPQSVDAIREPWMFRRSWMLGGAPDIAQAFSFFPTSNVFYGDMRSGPHIDVKSVRRIGQDDRLWFAVSTVALGPRTGVEETFTQGVQGYVDVRILGNTRKARNDGKF